MMMVCYLEGVQDNWKHIYSAADVISPWNRIHCSSVMHASTAKAALLKGHKGFSFEDCNSRRKSLDDVLSNYFIFVDLKHSYC